MEKKTATQDDYLIVITAFVIVGVILACVLNFFDYA
jgi:hypothetical protein